ncbi:MAG: hypothetical protein AB1716_15245, partial [Planctomycetota bacterium]
GDDSPAEPAGSGAEGGSGAGAGGDGSGGSGTVVLGNASYRDDGLSYDATRPFRLRDGLSVAATTDLDVELSGPTGSLAALNELGGLHVLARAAETSPAEWFTVQRLSTAVTRIRLLPGMYRIGPPAAYFSGGFSGLSAIVSSEELTVEQVAAAVLDPNQRDTALESTPEAPIYAYTNIANQLLANLQSAPSDYVNYYAPYGIKFYLSFSRLTAPAEEFNTELARLAAQMQTWGAVGVPVIPFSTTLTGADRYQDWFDINTWSVAAANFRHAVSSLGLREYAIDFEPYWDDPRMYPEPGYDTWRCWAALQPLLDAVRETNVKVYALPGSSRAPVEALASAAPERVTIWSEFGYPQPISAEPWWPQTDAEAAGAAALGRQVLPGYFDSVLRAPTPAFLEGQRARHINRFFIFPQVDQPAVWENYLQHFFTRAWFDLQ